MKPVFSKSIDEVLSVGAYLGEFGSINWALTFPQALAAVDLLEKLQVPVLGGEIHAFEDDAYHPTYDSWYCDRMEGEYLDAFVERSAQKARQYILNYPPTLCRDRYVVLVPLCRTIADQQPVKPK